MADEDDNSIPVRYINQTGNVDFEVMVFTRNYNTKTPNIYYVAWQVLRAQSSVDFTFSSKIQVGAFYRTKGQTVRAGPFDAEPGSTWRIVQNEMHDTATLEKITGVKDNPLNSIVVQSKCPTTWNGRKFNVGIYKNEKLLLTHEDVHVGDQVDFVMNPVLFFGIVRNVNVGDVFSSLEVMSYLQEFDLHDYPDGMEVTLNEEPTGGMYTFTAVNKVLNDYSA